MIPGEIKVKDGNIALNKNGETKKITVSNSGDRPIQVGSHYHFSKLMMHCYSIVKKQKVFA